MTPEQLTRLRAAAANIITDGSVVLVGDLRALLEDRDRLAAENEKLEVALHANTVKWMDVANQNATEREEFGEQASLFHAMLEVVIGPDTADNSLWAMNRAIAERAAREKGETT